LISLRGLKRQDPDQPAVKKYFMHGIGHSLGLGVHDVTASGQSLAAGWVMTVEPGIYIPAGSRGIPKRYWNIGVRIEDDVAVTREGCTVLTAGVPSDPDQIEALMRAG
jgi:Xaa-Pro aminopeptidase